MDQIDYMPSIEAILRHSLGIAQGGKPYRRHYCSAPKKVLREAVRLGFMTGPHELDWTVDPLWYVTEAGAEHCGVSLDEAML